MLLKIILIKVSSSSSSGACCCTLYATVNTAIFWSNQDAC
uniref:Uncharacterized protein n=1 Tax=Rhizophora mucronata TaxID=61149 RepID=A0A2P2QG27_RHIMU